MLLPDFVIRYAIRVRCKHTLIELGEKGAERDQLGKMMIVNELKTMPIAIGKCISIILLPVSIHFLMLFVFIISYAKQQL